MFFVVMEEYENIYVEWIIVDMNISLYSNIAHEACVSLMMMECDECKCNMCHQDGFYRNA